MVTVTQLPLERLFWWLRYTGGQEWWQQADGEERVGPGVTVDTARLAGTGLPLHGGGTVTISMAQLQALKEYWSPTGVVRSVQLGHSRAQISAKQMQSWCLNVLLHVFKNMQWAHKKAESSGLTYKRQTKIHQDWWILFLIWRSARPTF